MIPVPDKFHELAAGQVINPIAGLYISFDKAISEDVDFFTLNQSVLDGNDLIGSSDPFNVIQVWDLYAYTDYSDRLVTATVSRSFEFPYNTQSAMLDFTLANTDGYFTPGSKSSIDIYNLPARPVRFYAGFQGQSMVQNFIGITQDMPDIDNNSRIVEYHALDFLTSISNQTLNQVVDMRDARTDEILAVIVEQFGLSSDQYEFDEGAVTIPFVFFDVGQDAGEAIRQIVQAEDGRFWLNESGILRFQARTNHNDSVALNIPAYSIIDITPTGVDNMINRVKIYADVREVQEYQNVYEKKATSSSSTSNLWVVPANSTLAISASLSDPCYDVQVPTLGKNSGVSWFTAIKSDTTEVTSGVTATGSLTTNSYDLVFTNTNGFAVEIDALYLWGEPAKVVNQIEYDYYDSEAVEKYGEKVLEISDNPFFQSYAEAERYASHILNEYCYYNAVVEAEVKGDFSLQLGDVVTLADDEFGGAYIVDAIEYSLDPGNLTTNLLLHKYIEPNPFTLDQSKLNSNDLLG